MEVLNMKEVIKELVDDHIKDLGLYVDEAYLEKEEGILNLCIILDSEEVIDLNKITEASRIINPIMDKTDLIEKNYDVLDISSKEKGVK